MICKRCGKTINDKSAFCSNCGCDLRDSFPSNGSHLSEEQFPLQILFRQISKHKILVIVALLLVGLSIGSYIVIKKKNEQKKAEVELLLALDHYLDIVGTYTSKSSYNCIELVLTADGRAGIKVNVGRYNEKTYLGYWREKENGLPIEINFSDSFEIYIGNKRHPYCRELYLYDGRLWESMSAIRSHDYGASERMVKN